MIQNEMLQSLEALLSAHGNPVGHLANTAAFLWELLPDINWAGFYLMDKGDLWLGPFQGKIACMRIATNRGVCGAAFSQDKPLIVPDVHAFPGHIACDEASRSEVVLPIHALGKAVGVLDIDSPLQSRFDERDLAFLNQVVSLLERHVDFFQCGYDLLTTTGS